MFRHTARISGWLLLAALALALALAVWFEALFILAVLAFVAVGGLVMLLRNTRRDTARHRKTEEALKGSKEQFRSVMGMAKDAVIVADHQGVITLWNKAAQEIFGFSAAEAVGEPLTLIIPDRFHEAHLRGLERAKTTGRGKVLGQTVELMGRRKDGNEFPVELSLTRWRSSQGVFFTGIVRDITRRKRIEEALRESEQRLRQLTENIREVFWMTSADGHEMIYVSPAYEEVWGRTCQSLYENPRNWMEAIHSEDRERVSKAFFGGAAEKGFDEEYRIVRPDGSVRRIRDRGFPIRDDQGRVHRIAGLADDITELARDREQLEALVEERTAQLKKSHASLRVADRLASIGTLTAGLGHDMNNILFPIRCRFDALDWKKVPADLRDLLEATRNTIGHLQGLCDGLRLLAVDPLDSRASGGTTSLAAWWRQVEPLLSKMLPDNVSLRTDLAPDLPPIKVAPHRLTQAVLNLIVNAAEATRGGGRVRIWGKLDENQTMVTIGVTDDGVGMSRRVKQRAFDPFFTTKKRRLSTGLGLSLVHGVVTISAGTVSIESEPGKGTTVVLKFPVAAADALSPEVPAAAQRGRAVVSLTDRRRAAWVSNLLSIAGYVVEAGENGGPGDTSLWVTEPTAQNLKRARRFFAGQPRRSAIVLGNADADWTRLGAVVVEDIESLESIRTAVHAVSSRDPETKA